MAVATTTPAGRAALMRGDDARLFDNASPKLERKRAEAQAAAEALNTGAAPVPAEKVTAITIEVAPDGLHVRAEYTGTLGSIPAAIERLKQAGVLELVAANRAPRPSFGGAGRPPTKPLTQPLINDAGDPCCPFHTNRNGRSTPIRYVGPKDGRPGFWGCPSAAQQVPGETINPRGYCDLRFDWPAPAESTVTR